MIIVTGGAGFIGSNLVRKLNQMGRADILVVDNLSNGGKFRNLVDCQILDYQDKKDFLEILPNQCRDNIEIIFHQGACTNTMEDDGKYMMSNNYEYSKILLNYCLQKNIPLIYASSASVYGLNKNFSEEPVNERPLNVYGYSKLLFDQYVRQILPKAKSKIIGLRYFNVYGPREQHKNNMASVIFHLNNQWRKDKVLHLFGSAEGYLNGEQRRDFVYVDDVVNVNIWFWQHMVERGIYNVGTGSCRTFNDVARTMINYYGEGEIKYIPFPEKLKNHYQSFTQADISKLRKVGCDLQFTDLRTGINNYLKFLTYNCNGPFIF